MSKKFKIGDLVTFKFATRSTTPCVIVGIEEFHPAPIGSKYCSYDVYISEVGVIKNVFQRDIKKWKYDC
jgi:hypothetical protein